MTMDKQQKLYKMLFVLVIVLLTLPAIQQMTHVFPLKKLSGFEDKVEKPELTYSSYCSGEFQSQVDKYLRQNFGFREWLIPLYNQYVWDFYNRTENNGVFFGKDNWLFFYEMLQDQYESLTYKYCKSGEEMAETFERDARMVYYLQEILKEYGTTLFVCIAPSKNEVFPEFLPENDRFKREGGVHADEFYTKRFAELGVNCLDLNTLYKEQKGKTDYPLFYKGGSHYSHIAATYTADTLVKYMESISGLKIQDFEYGEPFVDSPKNIDRDMENLYNLIRPIERVNYEYVHVTPIPDSSSVKMRWLTIGDSFYWNISSEIRDAGLFESTPFWYYGKEVYFDPGRFYTDELNIVDELLSADILTILWCPINLYALEHNFVNNAVLSLCQADNYRNQMIECIKESDGWLRDEVKKAEERGIDIDEMVRIDADYMINQKTDNLLNEYPANVVPSQRIKQLRDSKRYFEDKSADEICRMKHHYKKLKGQYPDKSIVELFKEASDFVMANK